uniref:Endonuclease/exonuclease/phosphatase domain-containing protein n=1 Tax=Lactuca sativa TaxID=4236 RepID=A0A9R1X538_LACSA|nr:hypothetical protein LSAT_V11C600310020 [Lactuca sativa]
MGNLVGISGLAGFVNVYGPQPEGEKVKVWEELSTIKRSRSATWIFMGDFNVVRCPEERINSEFCHRSANAFNNFIQDCELTNLKMGGQRFTYFRKVGAKLSKLDHFLVCSSYLHVYPLASCYAMNRDLSNHSPIILKPRYDDVGTTRKQPFTKLIARRKRLRRRANACQGRPCHKERRRAFTTLVYDAQLRRAFTTRNVYQGRPCHKGRRHAFVCRNLTTRVLMTRNAYQEIPCQERPCHK